MTEVKIENFICPPIGTEVIWRHWIAGTQPVYLPAKVIGNSLHRIRIEVVLNGVPVKRSVYPQNICVITEDIEAWKKSRDWMTREIQGRFKNEV